MNNNAVKKTAYDKLATKHNAIDISAFVLKTEYNTDKSGLEKKINDAEKGIPDTRGFVAKMDYNPKISEISSKISSINSLATNSALNAFKNKVFNVISLVKKLTDYDAKIADIENKYIATADYHKFSKDILAERIKNIS